MTVSLTDLRSLPAPALLVPVDYAAALAQRMNRLVALLRRAGIEYDVEELETDPLVITEQAGAYRDILQVQDRNETALQLLVAFAKGTNLDHLGASVDTPRHADEDDDHYRVRIANALERPSTAGSAAGYREHAKAADPDVYDVAIVRPGPPQVHLFVLGKAGAPSEATLAAVRARISAEDVRPQNDEPAVFPAGIVTVDVVGTYQLFPGATEALVKPAGDLAIAKYVAKHYALGHDITLDGVKAAALVPGVKKFTATLNGTVDDLILDRTQAPRLGVLTTAVDPKRDE